MVVLAIQDQFARNLTCSVVERNSEIESEKSLPKRAKARLLGMECPLMELFLIFWFQLSPKVLKI